MLNFLEGNILEFLFISLGVFCDNKDDEFSFILFLLSSKYPIVIAFFIIDFSLLLLICSLYCILEIEIFETLFESLYEELFKCLIVLPSSLLSSILFSSLLFFSLLFSSLILSSKILLSLIISSSNSSSSTTSGSIISLKLDSSCFKLIYF